MLRVKGAPDDYLNIERKKPIVKKFKIKLSELLENDHAEKFIVPSLKGAFAFSKMGSTIKVHRIIPETKVKTQFTINDDRPGDKVDCYYIRVHERNGQLAWSSPIWVEKQV